MLLFLLLGIVSDMSSSNQRDPLFVNLPALPVPSAVPPMSRGPSAAPLLVPQVPVPTVNVFDALQPAANVEHEHVDSMLKAADVPPIPSLAILPPPVFEQVVPLALVTSLHVETLESQLGAPFIHDAPFGEWLQRLEESEFLDPLTKNIRLVLPRNRVEFETQTFPLSELAPWVTGVRSESILWTERLLGFVHAKRSQTAAPSPDAQMLGAPDGPVLVTDQVAGKSLAMELEHLGPLFIPIEDMASSSSDGATNGSVNASLPTPRISLEWLFLRVLTPKSLLEFDAWMNKQEQQLQGHTKRRVCICSVLWICPARARAQLVMFRVICLVFRHTAPSLLWSGRSAEAVICPVSPPRGYQSFVRLCAASKICKASFLIPRHLPLSRRKLQSSCLQRRKKTHRKPSWLAFRK